MKTSQQGIDLIKRFEGFKPEAYKDPVGVWTIGYGHTRTACFGMSISENEAESLLRSDVEEAERAIARFVEVELSQNQFDALVSWVFNLGAGALSRSTMLKKINSSLHKEVPDQMRRWVYAGGQRLRGLELRREAEARLYSGLIGGDCGGPR